MPGHPQINPYKPYDFDAANKNFVENVFDEPDMVVGARSRVGIITCCDARCSPDHFFQLKPNEAFVIRNGGGRTATDDVIRTLTGIQILSDISELKVIHHTDCGALVGNDPWLRALISGNDPKAKGGPFRDTKAAASYQEALAFMGFARREGESDHEVLVHSIVQDVEYLRNHPLIKPSIPVTGWLYDLHTGAVEKIEC